MKALFCSYSQAKELKELGFDEPCFGVFNAKEELYIGTKYASPQHHLTGAASQAPLKQQVFSWFRKKYNLYCEIDLDSYKEPYSLKVTIKQLDESNTFVNKEYYPYINGIGDIDNKTYEQAESECINKLISILKEKQ